MTAQELIDWYKANKASMPREPFKLEEYMEVINVEAFYAKLDKDVEEYPDMFGARRLIQHLGLLHEFVTAQA